MADSDKQILITPNISATAYPQIKYVGKDNAPMYQTVQDDGTVAFSGAQGEVFSIGPTMNTGNIFTANDISGIPLLAVGVDGNVGIGISSSLTAKLHIKTSGETDALRLDVDSSDDPDSSPFVIAEDGRVGIGTASPRSDMALTLNGDGTSYEGISFDLGGSQKWKMSTDSTSFYVDAQANGIDWTFRMRDAGGSLRPQLKLDGGVAGGTDNASGIIIGNDGGTDSSPGDCMNKLQINIGTTAGVQDFNDGVIIVNNDASIAADDMIAGIGFDTRDGAVPSRTTEASAYIAAYASEAHSSGDKGGHLAFGTASEDDNENVTSTERVRITDEGRVGIGTDSPATNLHVAHATDPSIRVQDTTDNYAATLFAKSSGAWLGLGDVDSGAESWMKFGAFSGTNNLNTKTRDFHLYGTNTATGFYFDESAGNFGIGDSSPATKLEVAGTVTATGHRGFNPYFCDLTVTSGGSQNINVASGSPSVIEWNNQATIQTDYYTHDTSTNSGRLYVDKDGMYAVTFNINWDNTGSGRVNIVAQLFKNGSAIPRTKTTAYSRGSSYGDEMNSLNTFFTNLSANDYLQVKCWYDDRDQSNSVDTIVDQCFIQVLGWPDAGQ